MLCLAFIAVYPIKFMRIPRFFIDTTLQVDTHIDMPTPVAHYIYNVLRLEGGTPVVLFNGDGSEYSGEISECSKRKVVIDVGAKLSIDVQSPLTTHLGQAVSKGDRMDFVLQKATELGVTHITPILTERCAVKLNAERWAKKRIQWQKIVASACEQSGRNTVPAVNDPVSLQHWLSLSTKESRLIFDPNERQRLTSLPPSSAGFRLLVGPEGGLTEQEVYAAKQNGYQGISMGPRILRTETAAIAALSALQAIHGDL